MPVDLEGLSESVLIQQDAEFSAQGDDIFDAVPGIHDGDCFGMGGAVPVVVPDLLDDGHLGTQYLGGMIQTSGGLPMMSLEISAGIICLHLPPAWRNI